MLLAVATVAQVASSVIRLGIPALMPFIRQELDLDRVHVGLTSTAVNAGAAAAGIPSGRAADRFGERRVIAYGTIACGVVILGVSVTSSFMPFLLILVVTGFFSTTSAPAGGRLIVRLFPSRERGTAMGVRQMGVSLGGAIAAAVLPPLALLTSWRTALSIAGIGTIAVGIASSYLYREPPDTRPPEEPGSRTGAWALAGRSDVRAVHAYTFLFGAGQWCYLTYLTLYLTEAIQISVIIAGSLLAVGQLCGTFGRIGWGMVSDRFMRGRRRPALLLVGGLAVLMTLGMAAMSSDTSLLVVTVVVALLGLTIQGWNGLAHTLAAELAGARAAGVAVGMNSSVGFVGVILLPPLFGAVVDWTDSYRAAWLMLTGLMIAALWMLVYVEESDGRQARA